MVKVNREVVVGVTISLLLHVASLVALSFIVFQGPLDQLQTVLDSVFDEERVQEEFTQDVEQSTVAADAVNYVSGSMAMGDATGGVAGPVVAQQKIEQAESLRVPDVKVNIGSMNVPGLNIISKDLGTGQVTGEVGRVVEGYGAALGQMTQELVRLMRESKVHVVWMFDESESMKDDQKEIRERFHKVYEELGLVQKHDSKLKASDEILLTTVVSFGEKVTELTQKPTSNVDEIRKAIDNIKVDESGKENTCAAIMSAVSKYQAGAVRQKRKLVVILVTDESGDDGQLVEETIDRCKKSDTPVYVLGHYSVFGYPYARMSWIDPKYKLTHWLQINRGPETPFPECLQFDGLHGRWDVFSSGFGPYEQVRMAKETGGIFFMLPGTEANLAGAGSLEQRKFDLLDMREYLPDLSSRVDYAMQRSSSRFREAQWQVIVKLNPHLDKELNMQEHQYSLDPAKFATQGKVTFDRAVRAMGMLNEAVKVLDDVKKLREREQSQRWRANYDLMHAQCLAYRVRLFQLLISLDAHQKIKPIPKDPKNNFWDIHRVATLLEPDKEQVRATRVDMAELKKQHELAKAEFQEVIKNHPRTPWARRAAWELSPGFGMKFVESFWDPRYDLKDIKLPKP
ncbi:MAG: vWA domain-containing protein [Planctomycetaceae bacterium]